MIVTCPSCSASYMVPPEQIGIEGRHVKCKKCHHIWFREGERKALDELISRIQSSDIDVDSIIFEEHKSQKKDSSQQTSLLQMIKNLLRGLFKKPSFSGSREDLLKHCASFMVALALFSTIFLLLVSQRWAIVHTAPLLQGVFESAGFPLFIYANVNPEDALIIEKPSLQTLNDKKVIQGNLINLSSNYVRVPSLKVTYLDNKNEVVLEDKQTLPIPVIKKEFSYGFALTAPDELPKTAKIIRLNFID